jgi:hypothetical protein
MAVQTSHNPKNHFHSLLNVKTQLNESPSLLLKAIVSLKTYLINNQSNFQLPNHSFLPYLKSIPIHPNALNVNPPPTLHAIFGSRIKTSFKTEENAPDQVRI